MLAFCASLLFAASGPAGAAITADRADSGDVELRGRAICVSSAGAEEGCGEAPRRFALRTGDGRRHRFAEDDAMSAIFADADVRLRELLVRARPEARGLETIKVYAIEAGRVLDLDYYCEVCNIVAYAPGPCPCCRQPLVLRVTPLP
jgi:hypothetical protein